MTVHTSRPRVSWSLNAESFEHLLRGLGRDREAAAIEYERLRHRLTAFFDWRGLADAEAAVDETFDRVARRLLEGEPIQHVAGYAYGVARLVAQETRRREHRQSERIESLGCHSGPAERITSLDHQRGQDDEPALERRQTCLDRCLETIPPRRRELILEYYRHDGSVGRTGQHRTQAAGLQLSAAALRVAAYRIRMVLERCVEQCMAEQDP